MGMFDIKEIYRADEKRYGAMTYRRSGRSGVLLSAVALGLWHNFGGYDVYDTARDTVRRAFDLGVTYFDLANNYGPPFGSAEETFGRILHQDFLPYRDEMFIATKAGYTMQPGPYGRGGSRKYLLASLDASLKRMGLEYVDLFYHHCMDPDTPLEESMGALAQAVHSGKALYVGLSNYSPEQAEKAVKLLDSMGVHCLIEQSRYNMVAREPEQGLLPVLRENGVGFSAFSPLAQGILTGKYNGGIPEDSRLHGKSIYLTEEKLSPVIDQVRRLGDLAAQAGIPLAEMALRWALRDPAVTTLIVGARTPEQLEQNVRAVEAGQLDSALLDQIHAILV